MCNEIVDQKDTARNPKPIPKEGIGWKVFLSDGTNYYQVNYGWNKYNKESEWITWHPFYNTNEGFCFFLDKKEAEKYLLHMKGKPNKYHYPTYPEDFVLKQIQYSQGIQERDESNISPTFLFRVAICKAFKILKDEHKLDNQTVEGTL